MRGKIIVAGEILSLLYRICSTSGSCLFKIWREGTWSIIKKGYSNQFSCISGQMFTRSSKSKIADD